MVFALVRQKDHKVIVKFENAPQSDADIESYLDEMRRVYKINNKFVVLYDCTDMYMTKISWKHIMMQANFMRAQEDATRNLMVRAAIVVNSDWARAILKTLFKVRKPACPLEIFNDHAGAKLYLGKVEHQFAVPQVALND